MLRRLNLSTIIFYILLALSFGRKFTGKLVFPFSLYSVNHMDFNSLILNLSCKDMFSNIKECAEQCYYREKNGIGCVGFVTYKNFKEWYICNPANVSEMNSNNTQINENDVDIVYILKYKKKKPVMYLPLEGDNITDTTVKGGVSGTLVWPSVPQVQAGKVKEGLHVNYGGRLLLDGTTNECLGNLALCTKGLSIALWVKCSSSIWGHITHSEHSINIVATQIRGIGIFTLGQSNSIPSVDTQSKAAVGTWTHVAVVFDPNVGMFVYMDGIPDTLRSTDEAYSHSSPYGRHDYVFGSKIGGLYPFDGTLDEIKVFYDSLTSAGKFDC